MSQDHAARGMLLLRPGEFAAVGWSAAYHFLILFSYFMLRPVRESMGIQRGYDKLAWLMTGTMIVMLLANPTFAAMVARFPRRHFIPFTYRFFALTLLIFSVLFRLLPPDAGVPLGYAMYIWLSVFNLFIVSVFWAFMADIFNNEQAKRLFGYIAVGGTLGALAGPVVTGALVGGIPLTPLLSDRLQIPPTAMLLVSCASLELAVWCVLRLMKLSGLRAGAPTSDQQPPRARALRSGQEPGPGVLAGLRLIVQSPLLMLIAAFMLLFTLLSSLLYMEQGRIVERTFAGQAAQTAAFAQLDFYSQALTLVFQMLISGRLIRSLGIGAALAVVPLVSLGGFAALMAWENWSVFAVFMVLRRSLHYALDRPAREALYTVVGPDARYKSKSFIDTFIYRGGDVAGAWLEQGLKQASIALGTLAIPLAAAGIIIASLLGRRAITTERP